MSLPQSFLDELRARTNLSALIGRSVPLKRAGREMKGCCPFHQEKSPSFYVNDEKGFYHCFGCSAHGDAMRWLTDQGGLQFIDAVRQLADAAGMEMPARDDRAVEKDQAMDRLREIMRRAEGWFRDNLASGKAGDAADYLESRGLTAQHADTFGIGWAGVGGNALTALMRYVDHKAMLELGLLKTKDGGEPYDFFRNRIMFPIHDARGRVIGFGGRALGDAQPKYLNSPETPLFDKGRTLFNLHRAAPAARRADRLIVVEGYMDVIALHRAGIDEAVAPNGTALTEAQLGLAWKLVDAPILSFDGDRAGRAAAGRAALRALPLLEPGKSLAFAFPPVGRDPDDVLREGGPEAVKALYLDLKPLVDVVWEAELHAKPCDTPESRAGLFGRLSDRVVSIKHRDVATAYAAELKARFRRQFAEQATHRPPPPTSARRRAVGKSIEAAIIDGLVRYPAVIARELEMVSGIRWSTPTAKAVVDALIDLAVDRAELTPAALAAQFERMEVADAVAAARAAATLPFSFTRDGGGLDAENELVEALWRMRA